MPNKVFWGWLVFSMGLTNLDQLAKKWAFDALVLGQSLPYYGWLTLSLHYNPGIGFSLFNRFPNILTGIVSGIVCYVFYQLYQAISVNDTYATKLALSCILGGGLGNLYDRIKWGAVVDFMSIKLPFCQSAVFNFADVLISLGFLLLVLRRSSSAKG